MEGAVFPPTLKTERKFDRKGMLTGTFGIEIKPFLNNAEIKPKRLKWCLNVQMEKSIAFPIEEAKTLHF